jgi:hypothetical protein
MTSSASQIDKDPQSIKIELSISFIMAPHFSDRERIVIRHIVKFGACLAAASDVAAQCIASDDITRRELDAAAFKCDQAIRKCVPNGFSVKAWYGDSRYVIDEEGNPIGFFVGDAKRSTEHAEALASFPANLAKARRLRIELDRKRSSLKGKQTELPQLVSGMVARIAAGGPHHAS